MHVCVRSQCMMGNGILLCCKVKNGGGRRTSQCENAKRKGFPVKLKRILVVFLDCSLKYVVTCQGKDQGDLLHFFLSHKQHSL